MQSCMLSHPPRPWISSNIGGSSSCGIKVANRRCFCLRAEQQTPQACWLGEAASPPPVTAGDDGFLPWNLSASGACQGGRGYDEPTADDVAKYSVTLLTVVTPAGITPES